ncbi:hypothetical protein ACQP1W_49485 [Spirillospora sp. CA-255316]
MGDLLWGLCLGGELPASVRVVSRGGDKAALIYSGLLMGSGDLLVRCVRLDQRRLVSGRCAFNINAAMPEAEGRPCHGCFCGDVVDPSPR